MDLAERTAAGDVRHPWESARARSLLRLLLPAVRGTAGRWLDVGSGDAWLAQYLVGEVAPDAELTCWDAYYDDTTIAELAATGGVTTTFCTERPSDRFDVLLLLDVLEHVEDDHALLDALVRENGSAGAIVLVTVPAYGRLYTEHDLDLHHFRRYEPATCRRLLTDCGLTILHEGGLFGSLLAVRGLQVASRRLVQGRPAVDPRDLPTHQHAASEIGLGRWRHGLAVTRAVTGALAADGALGVALGRRGVRMPGLSYVALCSVAPR